MTIDRVNRRLNRHGLPFFFQYAVGGAIATAPPILLYALSPKLGLHFDPTVAIAAGLVVLLAGLSLVGSVGDVISGAPVTAAGRFFELVMLTAATIAGVALVLHLASRFGAPFVGISASAPPALAELPARVAFGAASAAAFALACYAERSAAMAAAFGGAAGTIAFLLAQGAGLGAVVASFVAAVPIGLVGRLMERRNLAPPLVCRSRASCRCYRACRCCTASMPFSTISMPSGSLRCWVHSRSVPRSRQASHWANGDRGRFGGADFSFADLRRCATRREHALTTAEQTQKPPTHRVLGGFCLTRLRGAADASLEKQLALRLRQPTPDAVRLADGERVGAALSDHGATPAHLLGAELALRTGPSTLPVGVEEHRRIDPSAKTVHLPIPDVCVGSR